MAEKEIKPGYKTTEFVIALIALAAGIGLAFSAMFAGPDHWLTGILGSAVATLGALGYQVPRVALKKEAVKAEAIKAVEASKVASTDPLK